jgi:REP element-mobilizing transposase RayT
MARQRKGTAKKPARTAKKPKSKGMGWGGRRPGAGRKPKPGSGVPHRSRRDIGPRTVVLVTVKVTKQMGRLRRPAVARVLRESMAHAAAREGFRLCHYSIQRDRIHLLVEADDSWALTRAMQSWKVRAARQLNRELHRVGQVFADRYEAVYLESAREVREALVLVMLGARAAGEKLDPRWGGADPFSSARYFDGWAQDAWRKKLPPPEGDPPVAPAKSSLLKGGWRRYGAIRMTEKPDPTVALRLRLAPNAAL